MNSYEVAVDLPNGEEVATLNVAANGNLPVVTWALVSGKGSIDNAKFTLTSVGNTATIKSAQILTTGTYYFRVRVSQGNQSHEEYYKVYTNDKVSTVSVDSTAFNDSIAVNDEVATVSLTSGALTDVTITPESSLDDVNLPAMSYDGSTGKIEWTGNQSASNDYTYNIVHKPAGSCFPSNLKQEFESTPAAVELSAALCAYPGNGAIVSVSATRCGSSIPGVDNFAAYKSEMDDPDHGPENSGANTYLANNAGATRGGREAWNFDTSGIGGDKVMARFGWNKSGGDKTWYLYHSTATLPAVNNPLYNVPTSWSLIGKVTVSDAGTFGAVDIDLSNVIGISANTKICSLTEADAINDFSPWIGVGLGHNHFRNVNIELFRCPQ